MGNQRNGSGPGGDANGGDDLIVCDICGQKYHPALLDRAIKHMHADIKAPFESYNIVSKKVPKDELPRGMKLKPITPEQFAKDLNNGCRIRKLVRDEETGERWRAPIFFY